MPAEKKIKVLIIDDELLAREKIRTLLTEEDDIQILDECKNANEALSKVKSLKPDLIFLDIQMPGMDGFEMLENIKTRKLPLIIFTTAYNKYAIKAFDIHALDYLLKPFDKERFHKSIKRARNFLNDKKRDENNEKIFNLLKELKGQQEASPKYLKRMMIKTSGRILFLKTEDIDMIEASGNYLKIFSDEESYLIRGTMNEIEKKLDPVTFIRIHRSIIINLNEAKEFKPWFRGEYIVYLKNGTKLTSGRSYKNNLLKISEK